MPHPRACPGARARVCDCPELARGRWRGDPRGWAIAMGLLVAVGLAPVQSGALELGLPMSWAKRSRKKVKAPPPTAPPQSAYEDALDLQKPAIEECVMELGIKQGVLSVRLDIKVLVNRAGQPFGTDLQVTQEGGDQLAMTTCVKTALGLARFPQSRNGLTELHRQWSFAAQGVPAAGPGSGNGGAAAAPPGVTPSH